MNTFLIALGTVHNPFSPSLTLPPRVIGSSVFSAQSTIWRCLSAPLGQVENIPFQYTATMADDNDKALHDGLRLVQLAMEHLTMAVPYTTRSICPSADTDQELEQQEMAATLPTAALETSVQLECIDVTDSLGDDAERTRKVGADVICTTEIGNMAARRGIDGKFGFLKGLSHLTNGTSDAAFSTVPSSSRIMLPRRWVSKFECVSCFEKFPPWKCIAAPCSHIYCRNCVISLIDVCIQDESLYPVKCCKQPLSKTRLSRTLNAKRRATFESKCREFNTSPDLRSYCCNAECSAFLGSSSGRSSDMVCRVCRTSTCLKCRRHSHLKETCEDNADMLKVREIAQKEGWQTCPGCKSIVELHEGCFHMTCRCRTEFCYLCGSKWKRCKCMQWHEDQVVEDAVVAGNGAQNIEQEQRAFKRILMGWIGRLRR